MTKTQDTLHTIDDCISEGLVAPEARSELSDVAQRYTVAITPAMHNLIDANDPNDPIARQFVPDARELLHHPNEAPDPIGDNLKSPTPGLVHRYRDRVLLKLVDMCPVYCRFCFRREMVGPKQKGALSETEINAALSYIKDHPEIWEVIMTGGDPLVLSPRRIANIVMQLESIPHVKVIRWHSRVPVVAPKRVTPELVTALQSQSKAVFVALHANHARELTPSARAACRQLIDAGISMVSQTVLLRGVNNDLDTLCELMRSFVEVGIKPYYLHHGDLAPGTSHFRTSLAEGQALMQALRSQLSGLAQPTYVLDIPGAHGKVPANAAYVKSDDSNVGQYHVSSANNTAHVYQDCCEPPMMEPKESKCA